MSGPITLFDKSFIQSLSIDESVWFDNFFLANVCPLFFAETLADLAKSLKSGRTPEEEVGLIAARFPELHGSPNTHHVTLSVGNLMGQAVPMTGQIPLSGGRPVRTGGRTGVAFELSPEAEAFSRWGRGDFQEVERRFAKEWREGLKSLGLEEIASTLKATGIDNKSCKSLEDAKKIAISIVSGEAKPFDRIKPMLLLLGVPPHLQRQIIERWSIAGYPSLVLYAPYAAHVLQVEVFFQVALAAGLISADRASNKIDIAYLYYLPFCMLFVSSDKLHRRCAELFLRNDQQFIWGFDLKKDLKRLNEHYESLPEAVTSHGIMSFANGPPTTGDFLVTELWDKHLPRWRGIFKDSEPKPPEKNEKIAAIMNKIANAPGLAPEDVDFNLQDPENMTLERFVSKRKGQWWQVPKDLDK